MACGCESAKADQGKTTVAILIVNAIAILSEDRFLARSTSLPPLPPKMPGQRTCRETRRRGYKASPPLPVTWRRANSNRTPKLTTTPHSRVLNVDARWRLWAGSGHEHEGQDCQPDCQCADGYEEYVFLPGTPGTTRMCSVDPELTSDSTPDRHQHADYTLRACAWLRWEQAAGVRREEARFWSQISVLSRAVSSSLCQGSGDRGHSRMKSSFSRSAIKAVGWPSVRAV